MEFPQPEPGDNDDVAWAIQTANTMHKRGDHAEAIRWLQRAAEAAEAAGDDMRLLSLARAAAEFGTPKKAAAPPPAPQRPPPPQQRPSPQTRPLPTRPLPRADQTPAPVRQPPPKRFPRTVPTGLTARPSDAGDEVTHVFADKPSPTATPAPTITSTMPSAQAPVLPAQRVSATPVVAVGTDRRAVEHRAVRVAVVPAAPPGAFLVRPLGAGEPLPEGAREALLVPLHAEDDFAK